MEKIVLRCFYGVKRVLFQYGDGKLQGTGALTCSEHVIYYVLYQNIFYLKLKRFDLNYTSKITKYCLERGITPDELVWKEIYVDLELAKPPNLMKVHLLPTEIISNAIVLLLFKHSLLFDYVNENMHY